MDDATQKLVDEARATAETVRSRHPKPGEWASNGAHDSSRVADAIDRLADALEAAQRPPFNPLHESACRCGATGNGECVRPPVSPEAREEMEWAGIKALVESAEVPTGVRGLLLGEVFTIREAVDAEVVVRVILDALLARLSVPTLDVERLTRWLVENRRLVAGSAWEYVDSETTASALVAALPTLTREETNE